MACVVMIAIFILTVTSNADAGAAEQVTDIQCRNGNVDIIFVTDADLTIGSIEADDLTRFLNSTVTWLFNSVCDTVRIASYVYGKLGWCNGEFITSLDQLQTVNDCLRRHTSKAEPVARGLATAHKLWKNETAIKRASTRLVVLLITDGRKDYVKKNTLRDAARDLQEKAKAHIFVIGVNVKNGTEYKEVTGGRTKPILVETFAGLSGPDSLVEIKRMMCPDVTSNADAGAAEQDIQCCNRNVDVIFITDADLDFNSTEADDLTRFLNSTATWLFNSVSKTVRIAIHVYSKFGWYNGEFITDLNQLQNVKECVNRTSKPTPITRGLRRAKKLWGVNATCNGTSTKLVVLLTDGRKEHVDITLLKEAAGILRKKENAHIYVIGVNAKNGSEYSDITGGKSKTLHVQTFAELSKPDSLVQIKRMMCPDVLLVCEECIENSQDSQIPVEIEADLKALDITFVINTADTISNDPDAWKDLSKSLYKLCTQIKKSLDDVRFGAIIFNKTNSLIFRGVVLMKNVKRELLPMLPDTSELPTPTFESAIAFATKGFKQDKCRCRRKVMITIEDLNSCYAKKNNKHKRPLQFDSCKLFTDHGRFFSNCVLDGKSCHITEIRTPPDLLEYFCTSEQRSAKMKRCQILERNENFKNGSKCPKKLIRYCYEAGHKILVYLEAKKCSCESMTIELMASLKRCIKHIPPPTKRGMQIAAGQGSGRGRGRGRGGASDAQLSVLAASYREPVVDLLSLPAVANLLPNTRLTGVSIADLDNQSDGLFASLTDSKKLLVTRQTLCGVRFSIEQNLIRENFKSKGCEFLRSLSVETLASLGRVDLELSLDMCHCSEHDSPDIPAKMDVLCAKIASYIQHPVQLRPYLESMCPVCLVYVLQHRTDWDSNVLGNNTSLVCDKIGQSFVLSDESVSHWAQLCSHHPSQVSGCRAVRPSLLTYMSTLPNPTELGFCRDVLCKRLCLLTDRQLKVITHILHTYSTEDIGCLAYLDNVSQPKVTVPVSGHKVNVSGSCALKSRVLKREQISQETHSTLEPGEDLLSMHKVLSSNLQACRMKCLDIETDIGDGISPADVLDASQITECVGQIDLSACVQKTHLDQFHWTREQAEALHQLITKRHSFNGSEVYDERILGIIGLGLTPHQLDTMPGLTNAAFGHMGLTYGWSPEELKALMRRYLRHNSMNASELKYYDIVRLGHLFCGLTVDQVYSIPPRPISRAVAVVGKLQRCDVDVLVVIADYFIAYYGPVRIWSEDEISEFGIIIAGLSGDDLRRLGTALADHITPTIAAHIRHIEMWKISPDQIVHFTYDVAFAIKKRGLCSWMDMRQYVGYLKYLCTSGSVLHVQILTRVLTIAATSIFMYSFSTV